MTQDPPVSVIVVSHGRPALLRRALVGIGQLFYRPFELVVVADTDGLAAISDLPFFGRIKTAVQEVPNISAARNQGAALAGGEILAFVDDDAVPEPTWLNHLVFPLSETKYVAATGTVLGRNGISVQWANRIVDAEGQAAQAGSGAVPRGWAVKLEGTNMAIRRDILTDLGGFDPGFGFFLDETDLAFRLMKAGHRTGFAPLATVHHGYAESSRRRADRVPLSLREIGQSTALYLRKHAAPDRLAPALDKLRADQGSRVDGLHRARRVSRQEAAELISGLEEGIAAGLSLPVTAPQHLPQPGRFQPLLTDNATPSVLLSGRWFSRARLMAQAESLLSGGQPVSLFILGHSVRAHRVRFTKSGVWCQSGGLFGPSQRDQPRFTLWSFRKRILAEIRRVEKTRWISHPETGDSWKQGR